MDCLWQSIPYRFLVDEDLDEIAVKLDTIILSLCCSLDSLIDRKAEAIDHFIFQFFDKLIFVIKKGSEKCIFKDLYHKIDMRASAQVIIARAWRQSISDPTFCLCRKRLLAEYEVMLESV